MEYVYISLIAFPVSMVAFNAAYWGGVYKCLCFSEKLKMAAAFGIFQTGLFWLGSWTGNSFANTMGWLSIPFAEAFILMTGVKLIYGALQVKPEQKSYNLAKNGELIAVSFAASLNAFMIGLGYGLLRPVGEMVFFILPASVIVFSYAGDYVGKVIGKVSYPRIAGILAGISVATLGLIMALDLYDVI